MFVWLLVCLFAYLHLLEFCSCSVLCLFVCDWSSACLRGRFLFVGVVIALRACLCCLFVGLFVLIVACVHIRVFVFVGLWVRVLDCL